MVLLDLFPGELISSKILQLLGHTHYKAIDRDLLQRTNQEAPRAFSPSRPFSAVSSNTHPKQVIIDQQEPLKATRVVQHHGGGTEPALCYLI